MLLRLTSFYIIILLLIVLFRWHQGGSSWVVVFSTLFLTNNTRRKEQGKRISNNENIYPDVPIFMSPPSSFCPPLYLSPCSRSLKVLEVTQHFAFTVITYYCIYFFFPARSLSSSIVRDLLPFFSFCEPQRWQQQLQQQQQQKWKKSNRRCRCTWIYPLFECYISTYKSPF
jgi:hypothetical protein